MDNDIILKMSNISKSFFGVEVLHGVDFELKRGEVHVLIGENGAGKSTLMKILAGIYRRDSGDIQFRNKNGEFGTLELKDAKSALVQGISMVFQEHNLMNNMSIAENIYVGHEPLKNGIVDYKKMNEDAKAQLSKVNMDISPKTLVGSLSVAGKQCVEIAKCLSHNAQIIILDEPTSSLSEKEVKMLFTLIQSLKEEGVSIVYISHRMNEIFEIGDRITVFRDGSKIDTVQTSTTNESELVKMMIGRDFKDVNQNEPPENKKLVIEINDISVGKFDAKINIKAYAGEILGIFGLIGAGRTEMARQLFGVDPVRNGTILKNGKKLRLKSPYYAIRNNIGLIPEDRKEVGLITMHSLRDNLALIKLNEWPWVLLSQKKETQLAEEYIDRLSIVTRGPEQLIRNLSGGNQQKVVISKWLAVDMDVLILDEPTRGVDVGAKAEIYNIISEEASKGKCIVVISSDLTEILRVSHRVIVMHDGAVTMDAPVWELDQEKIMHAAISQEKMI